ncbi:MAG: AAA family ATPase [Gemmatimonadaceae bacterium]|jgi:hypothetical protein
MNDTNKRTPILIDHLRYVNVRGHNFDRKLHPITVAVGQNGAGKSSILWAVVGAIYGPKSNDRRFGTGKIEIVVDIDGVAREHSGSGHLQIARTLSPKHMLGVTPAPLAPTIGAAEEKIHAALGTPAKPFDLAEMTAKSEPEKRKALLRLATHVDVATFADCAPDIAPYDGEPASEWIARALKAKNDEVKSLQAQIREAETAVAASGDVAVRPLSQHERAALEARAARCRTVDAEIAKVERLAGDAEAAEQAFTAARARRMAANSEAPKIEPMADLAPLQARLAKAEADVAQLDKYERCKRELDAAAAELAEANRTRAAMPPVAQPVALTDLAPLQADVHQLEAGLRRAQDTERERVTAERALAEAERAVADIERLQAPTVARFAEVDEAIVLGSEDASPKFRALCSAVLDQGCPGTQTLRDAVAAAKARRNQPQVDSVSAGQALERARAALRTAEAANTRANVERGNAASNAALVQQLDARVKAGQERHRAAVVAYDAVRGEGVPMSARTDIVSVRNTLDTARTANARAAAQTEAAGRHAQVLAQLDAAVDGAAAVHAQAVLAYDAAIEAMTLSEAEADMDAVMRAVVATKIQQELDAANRADGAQSVQAELLASAEAKKLRVTAAKDSVVALVQAQKDCLRIALEPVASAMTPLLAAIGYRWELGADNVLGARRIADGVWIDIDSMASSDLAVYGAGLALAFGREHERGMRLVLLDDLAVCTESRAIAVLKAAGEMIARGELDQVLATWHCDAAPKGLSAVAHVIEVV